MNLNQIEEVEFSNILFNNENESFFYDKSLEFEINDFINDEQENDFYNDSDSSNDEFEENKSCEKKIPIFPSTKKLFYKKKVSFKENEDNETKNKNMLDTKSTVFIQKKTINY